jgi:hypothetical protein
MLGHSVKDAYLTHYQEEIVQFCLAHPPTFSWWQLAFIYSTLIVGVINMTYLMTYYNGVISIGDIAIIGVCGPTLCLR